MSYGNATTKYSGAKAAGKPAYAGKPAGKPAYAGKPAATESTGKRRPNYDIVLVDGEGQIVKTEEGNSHRLGAIWVNEKGGMFIKFNEPVEPGMTAKTFEVKQAD